MNVQKKKIVCTLEMLRLFVFLVWKCIEICEFLVWKCVETTDILVWKCLFLASFVWILENKLYLCTMFLMHLISENYLSI